MWVAPRTTERHRADDISNHHPPEPGADRLYNTRQLLLFAYSTTGWTFALLSLEKLS